jgi:VWFA-related protein
MLPPHDEVPIWVAAIFAWLLHATCAHPQEPQAEPFTLSVTASLATADVTVLNKRTGTAIEALTQNEFRVFDNDAQQPITHFSLVAKDDRPLAIVLLIEVLGYDTDVNALIPAAAKAAFAKLRPGDRVGIVAWGVFSAADCVVTTRVAQPLTADVDRLARVLQELAEATPSSRTGCRNLRKEDRKLREEHFDQEQAMQAQAIQQAIDQLTAAGDSRKELIAIEQDLGTVSREQADATRDLLLRSGIAMNAILEPSFFDNMLNHMSSSIDGPKYQSNLLQFYATETGGILLRPQRKKTAAALEDILFGISAQYSLAWKPTSPAGEFHRIRIELPTHPEATIQSRKRYLAATQPK